MVLAGCDSAAPQSVWTTVIVSSHSESSPGWWQYRSHSTGKTETGLPCHSIYHKEGKEKIIISLVRPLLCCDRLGWRCGNRLLLSQNLIPSTSNLGGNRILQKQGLTTSNWLFNTNREAQPPHLCFNCNKVHIIQIHYKQRFCSILSHFKYD